MTVLSVPRGLGAVAALVTAALAVGAQPLVPLPAARLAVVGHVEAVKGRWDTASATIVSYVHVTVTRRLSGEAPDRLVLKQLGGQVGEIGLFVAGQARFVVGEDAVLLLAVSPRDRTLHTAGLGRGKLPADAMTVSRVEASLARSASTDTPYVAVATEPAGRPETPFFAYLPTDGGYPARWHQVDDDGVVFVDHPSALPGTWTGSTANASAAINLWRGSGMELDLRDGGASLAAGQYAAAFTGSGRIGVSYNDPCGVDDSEADNWVIGGGYYTTGELRTVNGTTFQKFIQGFVVLNNVGPQSTSAGCFQDAITHGLGHALGLGHSTSTGAMMGALPAASCSAGPRSLGADDMSGITSIYRGIASGPFPPNAPTALTASASLSTVNLAWTPATTGGAAQRYIVDAGNVSSGIYNLGSSVLNSPSPSAAFGNVPPATYFVRVRAQNAAGTSGASPEAQVTVGACTAPGAPGTLSALVNDTTVNLAWSAPSTGVTQGYRLLVGSAPGLVNVLVQDYPASVTGIAAAGVPFGTYYVRVAATNACGVGPVSNELTVVVQPCAAPPQAPTGLNFSRTGSFVALAWTPPAAGPSPSSYTLVVGSQTGGSDVLVLSTGTATTLGAAAPPGTYFARIHAQNACGLSGASNEIVVVVP